MISAEGRVDALPTGVVRRPLRPNADERGSLTEVFRSDWNVAFAPCQWNVMSSRAGTLRGVHVHPTHDDYLVLLEGHMTLGLADLRGSPPPEGDGTTLELAAQEATALVIPHGVAHGFYFPVDSLLLYGVSHHFDPSDELGCRWDDPQLGIPWEVGDPILSERDLTAGSLGALVDELAARRERAAPTG